MADETQGVDDPKAAFAGLMSGAAKQAAPDDGAVDARYGWTTGADGNRRPKKAAGRPRKSPSLDELKAAKEDSGTAQAEGDAASGDRAPEQGKRKRGRKAAAEPAKPEAVIQHRPGVITKGVNRLYRKAGKIVEVMDADIGKAIIASTKNTAEDGEPDDSVGAAWDEVARTNPRIRKVLLKIIAGGAWGQLFMAHAPILLAIIMKDGIAKHIPFMKLVQAFLSDEDGESGEGAPAGLGGLLNGLTEQDMQQMMGVAQSLMMNQAGRAAAATPRAPEAQQAA